MPLEDLDQYIAGFGRFKNDWFASPRTAKKTFSTQSPKVLVIACSDSRVDPAILFDSDPGDFFVIRNVASLVPPYVKDASYHGVSASLEFAVCKLQVQHIIVLGHTHCSGIHVLMDHEDNDTEFIQPWLNIAYPALLRIDVMEHLNEEARSRACEREAVLVSLGNLLTFPWIREAVNDGRLDLHGWYFNMTRGNLERWSPKDKGFVILVK